MDNYFTLLRTIAELRARKIAVVDTARNKQSCPPEELKVPRSALFNDLFWCVDEFKTLVARLVDNNNVLIASTARYANESVECHRKRPRLTSTNHRHVGKVGVIIAECRLRYLS